MSRGLIKKVLIVEDDVDFREALVLLLKSEGVEVMAVGDAMEAMRVLREENEKPQLLVLDLFLPGLDGWGLLEKLRERGSWDVPVVAVTAYGNVPSVADRIEQAGFAGVIHKPIDPRTFVGEIGRFVGLVRLRESAGVCAVCGRSEDPLLDVVSAGEVSAMFGQAMAESLVRQTIHDGRIGAKRSGRGWLLRYVEVAAKWGGQPLPAFRYWEFPDLKCPMCGRVGDPLDLVVSITDQRVVGSQGHHLRYAVQTGAFQARKSGGIWLTKREEVSRYLLSQEDRRPEEKGSDAE